MAFFSSSEDYSNKTPFELGYRMPAEWEPHAATWLTWPNQAQPWIAGRYEKIRDVYLQLIESLLPNEKVKLLVRSQPEKDHVLKFLKGKVSLLSKLSIILAPVSDIWIRDYGPTFVKHVNTAEKAWCKWQFNAWGGKYPELLADSKIFENASFVEAPCFPTKIVFEGGSIGINGKGLGVTTEACLLNPNRNPNLSRNQIETYLRDYLGIESLIWLQDGIVGDDTDGHIDDVTRFVGEHKLVSCVEDDAHDPNYERLQANWKRLLEVSGEISSKKIECFQLPMPGVVATKTQRLPATYANFYIANEVVLVPTYQHKHDNDALGIIKEAFPKREIIAIDSSELIHGMGSLHCITQQEPL